MNILREYTLDYIKRNKKSSITIMIAMLIATILMNSMGIFAYNIWDNQVQIVRKEAGDWHGELYGTTWGKDLDYVKSYASVDQIMVKGQWYVLEVGDVKRPYLLMRDADAAYWKYMSEKNAIMEGRIPERAGEIAISKQFMEAHKEYQLGSQITLPKGKRIYQGEVLDERSIYKEGEKLEIEEEATYTIVGVLDMTTASITPAYTGIGYLEDKDILPEDDLTVYIRFKNIRDTYKELSKIAEEIGYEKDEYGDYLLRYNSALLSRYLVFPKHEGQYKLMDFVKPAMGNVVVAMVIGVFVFIIHNAFEVSMNHRKKQLGMFKSIGATPKQIKASIIFEAVVLSIMPIIGGLIVSIILGYWFIEALNKVNIKFGDEIYTYTYTYKINLWVELIVIALVLVVAWLSAVVPSRKISKKMPIEILRGDFTSKSLKKKKIKKHKIFKQRNNGDIYKELANNEFKANKKSFRTALISLTLSLTLFMTFLTAMGSGDFVNDLYAKEDVKENITVHIQDGNPVDEAVREAFAANSKIKDYAEITGTQGTVWLSSEQESEALKNLGGFEAVDNQSKYYIYKEDNQYRIRDNLVALDDNTFKEYCELIGVSWQDYYNNQEAKVILYNQTIDSFNSTVRHPIEIEFLNVKRGDKLRISEKVYEDDLGHSEMDLVIGDVTDQLPDWDISIGNYTLLQIMPLATYQKIIKNWEPEKALRSMRTSIKIEVDDADIEDVSNWAKNECEKIYGLGDYSIWNEIEEREYDEARDLQAIMVTLFITILFAVIGISNAFFTVNASLEQRSKSFSILRSVGIGNKGINRLLRLEALYFALRPIIYASILEIIWMAILIKMTDSSWGEFIAYVPVIVFIGFASILVAIIAVAYFIGSQKIRKQNIVEAIKDETV